MQPTQDVSFMRTAAADALCAGRAAARLLRSAASDPMRRAADPDPDILAGRLSQSIALAVAVAADVRKLLARCDALIERGTTERTDWMPKSVSGDDVTEWEPWTRPERTPEAEGLHAVACALRRFLARRDHAADLVGAEAALAVMRGDRSAE